MDSNYLHSSRLANHPCRLGSDQKAAAAVGIKEEGRMIGGTQHSRTIARTTALLLALVFPLQSGW